jgi:pimeloyl-ACP methyl ester carboxylesterase
VNAALKPSVLTKLMVVGRRAPLDRTPQAIGCAYEDVGFTATDGVQLRGWFIPSGAPGPGPAVAFVHGWLWNRLGNVAGQVPVPDKDVDFLPATKALHDAGYHVLLFDLRNHGRSGRKLPITYGVREALDVQGALALLRSRADVDGDRIGLLGCSMGANACLYGTPGAQPVKAILAVQATRVAHFNHNYALDEFGRIGPYLLKPVDPLYRLIRAPMMRDHDPAVPAAKLGNTLVQYVQGTGDPWGEMADTEDFVAATPNALPIVRYGSAGRYEGYRYVNEQVDEVAGFFRSHL